MKDIATLYQKHQDILAQAIEALASRQFYSPYPEHPKAYAAELDAKGKEDFGRLLNQDFAELEQDTSLWIGEEISPLWQMGIGVRYPSSTADQYVQNSKKAHTTWQKTTVQERAGILIESLERVRVRFFELAYATIHTTGQSFMMAFQASGPHAADRALEAIALGVEELTRYPEQLHFSKPLGKHSLDVQKTWKPISKGVGVVIGCSTFPTWNSLPGIYANLISGNTTIVKPHPKAILPIAIVVAEIRKLLAECGYSTNIVQLAADTASLPITKALVEHADVALIDYTGGNSFGDYVESLASTKTVFTEKSAINSILIDSVIDMKAVAQNIAFSVCLYSGQMCTAPQNIYIAPEIKIEGGVLSFDEVATAIVDAIEEVISHPKMGVGTLGCVQNDAIIKRIDHAKTLGGKVLLAPQKIENTEAPNARIQSPTVLAVDASSEVYKEEYFGPMVFLVRTSSTSESVDLAAQLALDKGAITCLAFSTDKEVQQYIEQQMNAAFTPVSFNMKGAGMVNQHAAFSDLHVLGGSPINPSGNATFGAPSFVSRRFVWVGNRRM